jgi:hypothetical protein
MDVAEKLKTANQNEEINLLHRLEVIRDFCDSVLKANEKNKINKGNNKSYR